MRPDDGRVISNFIMQALQNQDITIYGDGSQTRSFCYIDDMVEGIITMMNTCDNITGPVNLGNPEEISILELAKKIIEITNSNSKIVFKNLPEDDPKRRCPDINLAKNLLNWQVKYEIEKGLIKTIEYFKENL